MPHSLLSGLQVRRIVCAATAALLLAGCGMVSTISRPDEPTPTAVPTARFEIVADRSLNPDVNGIPKPVLLRFYELRATAAFDRAGFLDLQDKDETQLGGDFVRREEFLIVPGERRVIERKGNADVRAFGLFVAYRDLERSTWRATAQSPNSVELRRQWFGLGPNEQLKLVNYRVVVSRDAVRVELQKEQR